jgi:hypothetical protein
MIQALISFHSRSPYRKSGFALSLILIGSCLMSGAAGQSSPSATSNPSSHRNLSHYAPSRFSKRATMYYQDIWGIDSLTVRSTESGELIRFSYRVLNAAKAGQLNDKKSEPALIDPRAGVQLVVPSLEKVGQLRQSSTPEEGRVYWMAFSNPRKVVKKGDRVDVHIGTFRAQGLVVD